MDFHIKDMCQFTQLLKGVNIKEKINVISMSLFKMTEGYKNFERYIGGFNSVMKYLQPRLPEFKVLLFIDESITGDKIIYDRIKKYEGPNLILIKYECPKFIKNGKHIELFGTFIRMIPFFKFDDNFTNHVISCDIDISNDDIERLVRSYKYFKKLEIEYMYDTNMFYELLNKWALNDTYSILAGRQLCKGKFPLEIMSSYMECVLDGTCKDMDKIKSQMDFVKYSTFPYGIEEYFLNNVFLKYLRENKIKYGVMIQYSITAPFYYYFSNPINRKDTHAGKFFKNVIKLQNVPNDSYAMFKQFDNTFYGKNIHPDTNMQSIVKRYYDGIGEMFKKKDYSIFSRWTLKKILGYKKGQYIAKDNIVIYKGDNIHKRYIVKKSVIK